MDDRETSERIGECSGGVKLLFAIALSGFVHFLIALTCRFMFNWRIDDTMIQEEALGLLGANVTLFLLLHKARAFGRIVVAYWLGYFLGLIVAMAAIATSSSREPEPLLRVVITEIAATYCCPIAVGCAIIVARRANRPPRVQTPAAT